MELSIVKSMVKRAFENDKVSGDALKPFLRVKRALRKGSNARRRLLSIPEFLRLLNAASDHMRAILTVAMNTGMRKGELRLLRWAHIDREKKLISLPSSVTKEGKPKEIPINENVSKVLDELRPGLKAVGQGYHDFVFTFQGKPIGHKDSLKKAFMGACERARDTLRNQGSERSHFP